MLCSVKVVPRGKYNMCREFLDALVRRRKAFQGRNFVLPLTHLRKCGSVIQFHPVYPTNYAVKPSTQEQLYLTNAIL